MSERALVIVPTYNERENIRPLIESVLSKDARIDMLIVDDGSPDGTGAIVDEIAAANSRVSALMTVPDMLRVNRGQHHVARSKLLRSCIRSSQTRESKGHT